MSSWTELDPSEWENKTEEERLDEFQEIVKCRRDQILDVDRWKSYVPKPAVPKKEKPPFQPMWELPPGEFILQFGKHSGKKVKDVPKTYLTWMSQVPETNSTHFRRAQRYVKRYLAGNHKTGNELREQRKAKRKRKRARKLAAK